MEHSHARTQFLPCRSTTPVQVPKSNSVDLRRRQLPTCAKSCCHSQSGPGFIWPAHCLLSCHFTLTATCRSVLYHWSGCLLDRVPFLPIYSAVCPRISNPPSRTHLPRSFATHLATNPSVSAPLPSSDCVSDLRYT